VLKRTAWLLRLSVSIGLLGGLSAASTLACSCIAPQNISRSGLVQEAVNHADVVFVGVAETLHGDGKEGPNEDLVAFTVLEPFKGHPAAHTEVRSGIGLRWMSSCGFSFESGKKYVVFAHRFQTSLMVAACSYTAAVEDSGLTLRVLRKEPLEPDDVLTWNELQRKENGRIIGAVRRNNQTLLSDPKVYIWDDADASYKKEAQFERPDKDGSFESYFLPPGTYRITAVDDGYGPSRWVGNYGSSAGDTLTGKLSVMPGRDVRDVDIVLHPQRVCDIRGVVRSADGSALPLKGLEIRVTTPQDEMYPFLAFISPHGDGEFIVPRAPVGHLRLEAYVSEFADSRWERSMVDIEVQDELQNVEIVLERKSGAASDRPGIMPEPESKEDNTDEDDPILR